MHASGLSVRTCLFLAAAWLLQAGPVAADNGRRIIVVTVPVPILNPSPPRVVPAQPALQWEPPPALGPIPGARSPTARCFAGSDVCPLPNPDRVGEPCTCLIAGANHEGRALIPPSRDVTGRPLAAD